MLRRVIHTQNSRRQTQNSRRTSLDDTTRNTQLSTDGESTNHHFVEDDGDAILQNATIGFMAVQLPTSRRPNALKSTRSGHRLNGGLNNGFGNQKRARCGLMFKAFYGLRELKWTDLLTSIVQWLGLLDSLYILWMTPIRIGFFFDPFDDVDTQEHWTAALACFLAIDLALLILRTWIYRLQLLQFLKEHAVAYCLRVHQRIHPHSRHSSIARRPGRDSLVALFNEVTVLDQEAAMALANVGNPAALATPKLNWWTFLMLSLSCVPWELAFVFWDLNFMQLINLVRLPQAIVSLPERFSKTVIESFREYKIIQLLSFSTKSTIVYLVILGNYLCHVAACGYMLVAHCECGLSVVHCDGVLPPQSWVVKDRLDRGSFTRQYIRALYWGTKTMTTLGQGDLTPATMEETIYRIIVQFVGGLWSTAILTACSVHLTHKDLNVPTSIPTRFEQANKFLRARKAPAALVAKIQAYFQYMQRTRQEVEEEFILTELPAHYRLQCNDFIRYRHLKRIPTFRKRDNVFIRAILKVLESDFYVPNQVVVAANDIEELLILTTGEIRLVDDKLMPVGRLTPGNWHAEQALVTPTRSRLVLIADTFCEVWRLPREQYLRVLHTFDASTGKPSRFPASRPAYGGVGGVGGRRTTVISPTQATGDRHHKLSTTPNGNGSQCGLDGSGTTRKSVNNSALKKFVEKVTSDAANAMMHVALWRLPNSRFQVVWKRCEVTWLLFLLFEVPYHIAFQRDFAVIATVDAQLSLGSFVLTQVGFLISCLVELFFLVDLYLRCRCFVRSSSGDNSLLNLISEPAHIFRHFIEQEAYEIDLVTNLPLPFVWDLIPKRSFSTQVVGIVRYVRLLRLIRLRKFKQTMESTLLQVGAGPPTRMLVYAVVFCSAAAHYAACLFYLVANDKEVEGFRQPGYHHETTASSLSMNQCLEDASVFGNCTWTYYDQATFAIDAPYLRAIHWSLVLISTVGYGDIVAFSTLESLVNCVWVFVGAFLCYYMGSAISSVLYRFKIVQNLQQARLEEINKALARLYDVSDATRTKIRRYYATKWTLNGSTALENELLGHLPLSLRRQLRKTLYLETVKYSTLFATCRADELFLYEVAQLLQCEMFLRGVLIIRAGHLANELYMIQTGMVEMLMPLEPTQAEQYREHQTHQLIRRLSCAPRRMSLVNPRKPAKKTNALVEFYRKTTYELSKSRSRSSQRTTNSSSMSMNVSMAERRKLSDLTVISDEHKALVMANRKALLLPVATLKNDDCFGVESVCLSERKVYCATGRALTATQVVVLSRNHWLALQQRFPDQCAQIDVAAEVHTKANDKLYSTTRVNVIQRRKVLKWLGETLHPHCEDLPLPHKKSKRKTTNKKKRVVLDPDHVVVQWWHRLVALIVTYNFYQIIFRLAFVPVPSQVVMEILTTVDYLSDVLLWIDVYLKLNCLATIECGETVRDIDRIREVYKTHGWFRYDLVSLVPLYYPQWSNPSAYFMMTALRLPRLLRSPQLLTMMDTAQLKIQEKYLQKQHNNSGLILNAFDLFKFTVLFVSSAHYIGSLYYLIGRLQYEQGWVTSSWVSVDPILQLYPENSSIHYMRAMYWCLSTFTVVCFGDIWARNPLETLFCGLSCVLGWIFVGQVITKINLIMITLDKDANEEYLRKEDLEKYAARYKLPPVLRQRAMQSLDYKTECWVQYHMHTTFHDLPMALKIGLYLDMYGKLLHSVPEFHDLASAHIEAIATALQLEIYLQHDIIYGSEKVGTRLYFLQDGLAEIVSPSKGIVYGALVPGCMFGDIAFFLQKAQVFESVRAVRGCQVLQLERRQWNALWPRHVRQDIEDHLMPVMVMKYQRYALAQLNIEKNLTQKNDHSAFASTSTPVVSTEPVVKKQDSFRVPVNTTTKPTPIPQVVPTSAGPTIANLSPLATRRPSTKSGLPFTTNAAVAPSDALLNDLSKLQEEKNESPVHRRSSKIAPVAPATATAQRRKSSLLKPQMTLHKLGNIGSKPSRLPAATEPPSVGPSLAELQIDKPKAPPLKFKGPALSSRTLLLMHGTVWKRHMKRLQALQQYEHGVRQIERIVTQAGYRATLTPSAKPTEVKVRPPMMTRRATIVFPLEDHVSSVTQSGARRRNSFQSTPHELQLFEDSALTRALAQRMQKAQAPPPSPRRSASVMIPTVDEVKAETSANKPTHEYHIWAKHAPPASVWTENSVFRGYWDTLMVLICLYYVVLVPFRICFLYDTKLHAELQSSTLVYQVWFVLEFVLTDLPCIADFILRRRYFCFLLHGEVVTDPKLITFNYWYFGTYRLDVLSMLPFELVVFFASSTGTNWPWWHQLAVAKANRFLRGVVHLYALRDRVQKFFLYERKVPWLRPSFCYVLRMAIDFLVGTHWVACFFYGVSFWYVDPRSPSWLTTPGMLSFQGVSTLYELAQVPVWHKYVRAYHFSIGAISTVCYGDILPMNAVENIVTLVIVFFSVSFYSIISGGFYKIFEMAYGKRAEYEEKVTQVSHFMVFHQFSARMWRQMQVYFAMAWQDSKGMKEDEMLRGIPTAIKQEILLCGRAKLLTHVSLLQDCEERFAKALVAMLQQELFVRNDVIMHHGDPGRSLYIIESGLVSMRVVRVTRRKRFPEYHHHHHHHPSTTSNFLNAAIASNAEQLMSTTLRGRQASTLFPLQTQRLPPLQVDMASNGAMAPINPSKPKGEKLLNGPFDYFGEQSLLFGTPRDATCIALCVCRIFVLQHHKYEQLLDEFPSYRSRNVREWALVRRRKIQIPE